MMSLIGISMIFFFAGSYFYLSPEAKLSQMDAAISNATKGQLCQIHQNEEDSTCQEDSDKGGGNDSAYIILILGALLTGIGGSSCVSMVFGYIDENINKADSAIYIGTYMPYVI